MIESYLTRSSGECHLYCSMNEGCRSFNYQYTPNLSGMLGVCEINNGILESCSGRAVEKVGYGYYRDIDSYESSKVNMHTDIKLKAIFLPSANNHV